MRNLVEVSKLLFLILILYCIIDSSTAEKVCGDRSWQDVDPALLNHVLYTEPNRHLDELSQISDVDGSLVRTFMSPAHMRAAAMLRRWMQAAGMQVWMDDIGNVHGRVEAQNQDDPILLIGSHYDTVIDAGRFDGALGIIVGIAAIKAVYISHLNLDVSAFNSSEEIDIDIRQYIENQPSPFRYPIEVVGFSDEEGVRFQTTFLGSRAVSGSLISSGLLNAKDKKGMTLQQVLFYHGLNGSQDVLAKLALKPSQIKAYIEVHIEQGPVLEEVNEALGGVSGIAGQCRMSVQMKGEQGHAGTVPMSLRKDSLAAASQIIQYLESVCRHEQILQQQSNNKNVLLVCTVGEISIWPGASNVIPGAANFSLDIRSNDDGLREKVVQNISEEIIQTCNNRGIWCNVERKHDADAVQCNQEIVQKLLSSWNKARYVTEQSCPEIENDNRKQAPVLVSGAGHDALAMHNVTEIGMLFVRCRGGVSHSPLEFVEPNDVMAAVLAIAQYITDEQFFNDASDSI